MQPSYPPQQPSYPPAGHSPYLSARPPAPSSGMSIGAIIGILAGILALGLVAVVGIFAALGVFGTRKYISNAKQAEAKASLAQIGRLAVTAYERENTTGEHELCPSSRPIPALPSSISGKKYVASPSEYANDPGFRCLGFELSMPQYFQYEYQSTTAGFVATARGDLNGDGKLSSFVLRGEVRGGTLVLASAIEETNPDE